MEPSPEGSRTSIVERFYAGVSARDAEAIGSVVDDHFAEDASVEWPPSLPYGGRVEGAQRLRKMFVGMTASEVKIGPDAPQVTSITASGDTVAAELSFDWYPPGKPDGVPSGALELWTFDGDKVRSIRAFYWDTAALAAAMA